MEQRKIRVAITHGDTNGVGYELIFKTFAEPEMLELCTPIIYGSPKVAAYHRNALQMEANFSIISDAKDAKDGRVNMIPAFEEDVKVELGTPSAEAAHASLMALDRALTDWKDGLFDVLVACPVNEKQIMEADKEFGGQAAYICESVGEGRKPLLVMQNEQLRMGLLTDKMALKDVAATVTKEAVGDKIKTFITCLKRDYTISNPRVAVLSLNPQPSAEEQDIISPAIEDADANGIYAFGPYAADTFFANGDYREFDGVLAMYHDQGTAPFAALSSETGVRLITGLPLVVTAPMQGVEYDLAGKGKADESGLRHAIYLAIDVFRNRQDYDEPLANPLPKLHHEHRDDSEKVRFSIPKKHENAIKERIDKPQPQGAEQPQAPSKPTDDKVAD